jgi:integrase
MTLTLVYKRPDSPNFYVIGTKISTKTTSRRDAEEMAKKVLREKWRTDVLGEPTRTWKALVREWLEYKAGQASLVQDQMVIGRFSELLERECVEDLEKITMEIISAYARAQKAQTSPSTANRHLNTIRAMLNRAKELKWLHDVPTIESYELPKKLPKGITPEQLEMITTHLPPWVAQMAVFAAQTGLRRANVAGLKWEWISADGMTAVVPGTATKTKRVYTVPLSTQARAILAARPREGVFVFPQERIRPHWEKAREAAGLAHVRFHDLRHSWASWHVQNGTPDRILMHMGGWTSPRMLANYAHLATEHLAAYADNLNGAPK